MMTSEKQLEANKANSQLSTGPQNTGRTRFNAVKHGLYAKKFMYGEDKEELNSIMRELIEDQKPENVLEFRIIERMAFALWELQKIEEIIASKQHNSQVGKELVKIKSALDIDITKLLGKPEYTPEQKKQRELILARMKEYQMPDETLHEYKISAENRFYRALKAWKDLRS